MRISDPNQGGREWMANGRSAPVRLINFSFLSNELARKNLINITLSALWATKNGQRLRCSQWKIVKKQTRIKKTEQVEEKSSLVSCKNCLLMPRKSSRLPRSANKIKLCPGIKKLHWKLWEIVCAALFAFLYLATKNGVENCVRARKLPRTLAVNASLIKCPAPKHRYSSLLLDETTPRAANVCVSVCVCVWESRRHICLLCGWFCG